MHVLCMISLKNKYKETKKNLLYLNHTIIFYSDYVTNVVSCRAFLANRLFGVLFDAQVGKSSWVLKDSGEMNK